MKQADARLKGLQGSTLGHLNQLFDGPVFGVEPSALGQQASSSPPPEEGTQETFTGEEEEEDEGEELDPQTQGLFVNRNIQIAPHFKEYTVEKRKILT